MFPPIYALCKAAPAVTALLGAEPRLFPFGEAEQNTARPYAVWQTIYGTPTNYISNRPDADSFGTQIDVYALQPTEARQVAQALRDAIEGAAHIVGYNGEFRDPVTRDYRYSFNVDWIVNR